MPQNKEFNSFESLLAGAEVVREDSAEGVFFQRQLEVINPMVFEEKKPKLNFLDKLSIKSDLPMWVEKSTYKTMSDKGIAKYLDKSAKDFPFVTTGAKEDSTNYRLAGVAVCFSLFELQAAAAMNMSLDQRFFLAARRAIEELANKAVWQGDAEHGIHGFLSHPGILKDEADNAITSAATGSQMTAELNKCANGVPNATNQVEEANTLLLPPIAFQASSQQTLSDTDNTKVLPDFLATNGAIEEAHKVRELANATIAGESSTRNAALAYDRDPSAVVALYSGIKQLPLMQTGPMTFMVPYVARIGGIELYRPKSAMLLLGV